MAISALLYAALTVINKQIFHTTGNDLLYIAVIGLIDTCTDHRCSADHRRSYVWRSKKAKEQTIPDRLQKKNRRSGARRFEGDLTQEWQKSVKLIAEAADKGADLVCFQEIQLSPFFPQYPHKDVKKYMVSLDSDYVKGIQVACRDCQIFASPNFYIEEKGRRYDMSLLVDDRGEIIGRQKMVHVAQCEQFYEQDYYEPSEEGFDVFDTKFGKIGIVVCFDRHYPESIRTEALRGAELIIIPTANTKSEPSELFQ